MINVALTAMKISPRFLVILALSSQSFIYGEDLTTLDGVTYKNIKVSGEKRDTVKVTHEGGIDTVQKKNLPADFLSKHELSAVDVSAEDVRQANDKATLAAFIASTPTFTDKDGKEYKSSQIRSVEPSGFSIFTDNGPVRVKFADLPEKVRSCFHYDEISAFKFDSEQSRRNRQAVGNTQRMVNAASVVDGKLSHAKLTLEENVGKGWRCHLLLLHDVDKEVVTAKRRSALDDVVTSTAPKTNSPIYSLHTTRTPTYDYEKTKVQTTEVAADEGSVMLFGLPDYARLKVTLQTELKTGKMKWEGDVYRVGLFRTGRWVLDRQRQRQPEIVDAYVMDRNKAIKLVADLGADHIFDTSNEP